MSKTKTFYGTFGWGNEYDGQPVHDYYVTITATDEEDAEKAMTETFGKVWHNVYPADSFEKWLYSKGELMCLDAGDHSFNEEKTQI